MNPNYSEEEGLCFPLLAKTLSPSSFRSPYAISDPYSEGSDFLDMEKSVEFDMYSSETAQFPLNIPDPDWSLGGHLVSLPPSCQKPLDHVPHHPKTCSAAEQTPKVPKEQIVSSPSQFSDDEDWEEELSSLVDSLEDQRVVPSMDSKVLEMLLTVPIRDFNVKTKSMKIDAGTLKQLKACRKRRKNRDAAVRSRSRKEQELVTLRSRVEALLKENDDQKKLINNLLTRVGSLPASS